MSLSSMSGEVEPEAGLRATFRRIMEEEFDDVRKSTFWRAVFAEFLGCLLLVFFGVGAGLHEEGQHGHGSVHIILGAGFFIAVIVSVLLNVSGGHVNPALSLAFAVSREISFLRFVFYSIAQMAGAVAGAALIKILTPPSMHGTLGLLQPSHNVTPEQALCVEAIISFFLIFVIFSLIDKGRTDVAGSIPFIVGLTVCVNIFFSGHISGGCINPIRNFGPAVVLGDWRLQWIYWVGPMIGAAIGSLLYSNVFSVAAGQRGIMSCAVSRKYKAVASNDLTRLDQELEVPSDASFEASILPKKKPLSESVERVASV